MNDVVTEIRKIPAVTRFLCISFVGVSIPVFMKAVPALYGVPYNYNLVFQKLQIWRLYTSFFLGSQGISFIFELITLYRCGNDLERFDGPYYLKSADLAWQMFAANIGVILLSLPLTRQQYVYIFFRPFLHLLIYISSALAPLGAQMSIFGLITVPVTYNPWIMLAFELLGGGPGAVAAALPGTVMGHLWWWGVWGSRAGGAGGILQEWGIAPAWLRSWFGESGAPRPGSRNLNGTTGANAGSGIHVVPPRRQVGTEPPVASGSSSSGYRWGSGNKLGSS
ncbi:Der1-like family-domain-containing protein [Roridomyces roridus]|uniref:Derlin n=1 Tax=Roridomyces roridus TaxID=1738132 RepID=A0AAD7FTR0_9AGAR|nr:Der1-like family-domain-containing protein [Roridomyces roridus]